MRGRRATEHMLPHSLSGGVNTATELVTSQRDGSGATDSKHPKASRELRPEQWSTNSVEQGCDTSREAGPQRTERTINIIRPTGLLFIFACRASPGARLGTAPPLACIQGPTPPPPPPQPIPVTASNN
ncbi:unnamed protein product [Pleuronectes platessa]|uniref:Uncharacterized protein n=1 Tax=Pleuronectes platessa TaxID=8262 RepID=A0A9N7YUT2_PLEPL|nr:unnamed protein product [Pleuronectes platessa]